MPCVAKLNLRTGRLSLLAYQEFDNDPFPVLAASWAFAPGSVGTPTYRVYTDALNPPILHRKELLVGPDYPGRADWQVLTQTAESLGLFDDTATIGFKLNWERLIASKGFELAGTAFLPIGNDVGEEAPAPDELNGPVQRHRTALHRSTLSAPVQLLIRHGLLSVDSTVFDYGCGRGDDIEGLKANGLDARGWDPHYAADQATVVSDVVNLGFVINVIEDPAERVDTLHRAFKLARRVLSVGVMLHGSESPGRAYRDGYVTSRNTFQKYFAQAELKDYLEHALQREAFMVGPGVAFVFADRDEEQRFSSGRFRTKQVAERLLLTRPHRLKEPRLKRPALPRETKVRAPSRTEQELVARRPHLDALWAVALNLGRLPESDEVSNLEALEEHVGGLARACRLLPQLYDQRLLESAATTRADDVRLFLAAQQFQRRPAYKTLETRLQRDIRAFFGDYRSAEAAGLQLLFDAADPDKLLEACRAAAVAGLGWLEDDHSLQMHVWMVERLPVVLRAYVTCGLILWDALSEVQLLKIHVSSGKLTLMEYDDFDGSPVPLLKRRVKVNVRRLDYEIFDYGDAQFPKPLLYRKSRYLHEDYPGYAEQASFDEALERLGILGESPYGPSAQDLAEQLEARRLRVDGSELKGSARIPDLDRACGENFTFRSFIECGETQRRLGLRNIPLKPATYNALYALATEVMDPLIAYFGDVRLTYGFCSAELGAQISKRVAPKLDQHAAYEINKTGRLICDRGGAACDFIVDDEDMREVAEWLVDHTPFDRMYFYGSDRPIHVSYSATPSREAYEMSETASGRLIPRRLRGGKPEKPTGT